MHFDEVLVETLKDFLRFQTNHFDQLEVLLFCSCLIGSLCLLGALTIFAKSLEQSRLDGQLPDAPKYFISALFDLGLILGALSELTPPNTTEIKENVLKLKCFCTQWLSV